LSTKLFSRGALDENIFKEEIKLDPPKTKTEPGKVGKKSSEKARLNDSVGQAYSHCSAPAFTVGVFIST
jgi:hypothetical protein